ncbi:hypothetical protein [Parasitella parasitica]|uniref:Uncharacterized protein n=1 Tax=Parasitella parasitica TaxID=35722 RepID=A0A0B7MWQ4_9FUNG|nr:hypothetical protein [Parasitella parasitica]
MDGDDNQVNEDLNYLTPDKDGEGSYFHQKPNRILFGLRPWDPYTDVYGTGYVKIEKSNIDDMVPTPETSSEKSPEPSDQSGSIVYVVSYAMEEEIDGEDDILPNEIKAFSTEEEGKIYMKDLAKRLFYGNLDIERQVDETGGYLTPDEEGDDWYFNQDDASVIKFGQTPYYGSRETYRTGYVSVDKLYVDGVEPTADSSGNKRRKLE